MSVNNGTEPIPLRRKVLRRFYEPLLLLNALGQVRGSRIKPDLSSNATVLNHRKIRRSFADGIAYICAYRKEPDYVTAVALERTPQGIDIWVAANANIEPNVVEFLNGILKDLSYISRQGGVMERHRAALHARDDFTRKVITFNIPRILEYLKMIRKRVEECVGCMQIACQSIGMLRLNDKPLSCLWQPAVCKLELI
jgi:hypothetical protein